MKRWIAPILAVGFVVGTSAPQPYATADDAIDTVQIITVNGVARDSSAPINVRQGDVIAISADIVRNGGDCSLPLGCPFNVDLESFDWTASDAPNDRCDTSDKTVNCKEVSNFEINNFGVNFYVPQNMVDDITVTAVYRGNGTSDSLILHNVEANVGPLPTEVVTQPEQFPDTTDFSDDTALVGMGSWVTVNEDRFFVPYNYQADWEPYQNGSWSWEDNTGWNWVSYDPWGWYTDHYGVWRHHGVYGWMWLPFQTRQYVPCTASWIYSDTYVGWYPYYSGYRHAYRHNHTHGFDDGYWDGYNAAPNYLAGHHHHGFTVLNLVNFNAPNIRNVNRVALKDVPIYLKHAWEAKTLGQVLGSPRLADSREWINRRVTGGVPVASILKRELGRTKTPIFRPNFAVERKTPELYQQVAKALKIGDRHPVGTLVKLDEGKAHFVPPTENGRGLANPHRVRDGAGKMVAERPRTNEPAKPHPENPLFKPEPHRPIPPNTPPTPTPHNPVKRPPLPTTPPVRPNPPTTPTTPTTPTQPPRHNPVPTTPTTPTQPPRHNPVPTTPTTPTQPPRHNPVPTTPTTPTQPPRHNPVPTTPTTPTQPPRHNPVPTTPTTPTQPPRHNPVPTTPTTPTQPPRHNPVPTTPTTPTQPPRHNPVPTTPTTPTQPPRHNPVPTTPTTPTQPPRHNPQPTQPSTPSQPPRHNPQPSTPSQPPQHSNPAPTPAPTPSPQPPHNNPAPSPAPAPGHPHKK